LHTEIGALGGKKSGTGGFWHLKYVKGELEKVREFGRIGGKKSTRKPKK
jgi:general stress protein YciG